MTGDAAQRRSLPSVSFAASGNLDALDAVVVERLIQRTTDSVGVEATRVADIIERVRTGGDTALREMAAEFDGVRLSEIEVPADGVRRALEEIEPAVREALEQAAAAIAAFHRHQLPDAVTFEPMPGLRLSRIAEPVDCVGVYAPGGRAAYPSSVLMGAVPARVAGVQDVVVCSPPTRDGRPSAIVLAACAIARVDRVFAIGGAGAIAALAYGTRTVPRVARVVGPGNAWVTEAKRQLQGRIAIDCPAGPSEILILADASADALMVAAELVAQAEHDPDAAAILLATDETLPGAVAQEVARLLHGHARAPIVRAALANRGALLHAGRDRAIEFANRYAPEHLLVAMADARSVLPRLRNAGTIFVGESSSVAFGDYLTGANHTLPTGGMARSFSGLNVLDFIRWTTVQEVSPAAAADLAGPTALLAEAEGLPGHAHAARLRARPPADDRAPGRTPTTHAGDSPTPAAPVRLREAYRSIETYDPGRTPVPVDLSDNTNLFGVCPAVRAALADAPGTVTTRYPSVYADELVAAAAERFRVHPDQVVTGCGSDDVIDSAVRAFCDPGDAVVYPWPTFGVVPTFARMNATRPIAVDHRPDEPLDRERMLQTRPRLVYICRPNNPTGSSCGAADLLALAGSFEGVVMVDEAYADFAADDLLQPAVQSRNIIVLRTLSKAYGLAGLRIGFAVGPAALVAEIAKSRGPYKIGGSAQRAGIAALRTCADWVAGCVRRTRENRERLRAALTSAGHDVLPSNANFLLVRLPAGSGAATDVSRRLRQRGVGVRPFDSLTGLGNCIRVTVGPWEMMETFLDAFETEMRTLTRGAR